MMYCSSLLLLLLLLSVSTTALRIPCNITAQCVLKLGVTSECRRPPVPSDDADDEGFCSNPFGRGCLQALLTDFKDKPRVCNSEDDDDAAEQGLCREPELPYMEIRLQSQNWESAMFVTWILQIILSELLGIPTSVETGLPDGKLNYYDAESPFDYGTSSDFSALSRATQLVDCRLASRDANNYEPCAHLTPEEWHHEYEIERLARQGVLENPTSLGAMGHESWFIPKYTAEHDPSILSHFGLTGEDNRQKLAEMFKRPTTWKDYCDFVSPTNCAKRDETAARAPRNAQENERFFVPDLYTGHFRYTERNNCTLHPTTCTGHIADFPCDWTSYIYHQTSRNQIALEVPADDDEGEYSYDQLQELWLAANATQSHVIGLWWTPQALHQEFVGTDSELIRVQLPEPTQACIESRQGQGGKGRCAAGYNSFIEREADPRSGCDTPAQSLQKIVSTAVFEATYNNPEIPEALQSPAFEAIDSFRISEFQIAELLRYWQSNRDNPREAVCHWVVGNREFIETFVPRTYPRVIQQREDPAMPLLYATTALGGLSILLVLITAVCVFLQRHRRIMQFAQVEFLWLLLSGSMAISIGAVIAGGGTWISAGSCVAVIWLINVGYTLELVPLIVKVAAINKLMQAAQQHKRVVLKRTTLFGGVVLILCFVVMFCSVWTAVDPPAKDSEYKLLSESGGEDGLTEDGETIVTVGHFCNSDLRFWWLISVSWNAILLASATVLAFETRNVRQDFNESQTLAFMIYSHSFFVVLRGITLFLQGQVSAVTLSRCQSLIYSVDTITTVLIYFFPKFIASDRRGSGAGLSLSGRFIGRFINRSWREQQHHQQHQHSSSLDTIERGGSFHPDSQFSSLALSSSHHHMQHHSTPFGASETTTTTTTTRPVSSLRASDYFDRFDSYSSHNRTYNNNPTSSSSTNRRRHYSSSNDSFAEDIADDEDDQARIINFLHQQEATEELTLEGDSQYSNNNKQPLEVVKLDSDHSRSPEQETKYLSSASNSRSPRRQKGPRRFDRESAPPEPPSQSVTITTRNNNESDEADVEDETESSTVYVFENTTSSNNPVIGMAMGILGCETEVVAPPPPPSNESASQSPSQGGEDKTDKDDQEQAPLLLLKKAEKQQQQQVVVTIPPVGQRLGICIEQTSRGIQIAHVDEATSPLQKLIRPGDLIVAFCGVDTTRMDAQELRHMLDPPTEERTLTILSSSLSLAVEEETAPLLEEASNLAN